MKRLMTIICSLAFAVYGIAIALTPETSTTGYKSMYAATTDYVYPTIDLSKMQIPKDLSLDLAKKKASDTVYITKTDTVPKQVTMVKWRQAPAPDPIVVRDTIWETRYYLAKQVGNKEGPTEQCIPVYEVHKVNELCPENTNSSTEGPPNYWKVDD